MFEHIKENLQEIIEIAESCPERYRDTCFELLLQFLLSVQSAKFQYEHEMPTKVIKQGFVSTVERPLSLPELKDQINPKSAKEFVILCAHWLEQYQGKLDGYTSSDIVDCLKQLRYNLKNPYDAISKAKREGYLIDNRGTLLLSQKGIEFIKSKLEEGKK
jgi:hypothetical protein